MESNKNGARIIYLDYLRIISIFAVVVIHVCDQHFNDMDINSFDWLSLNFFDSVSRFAVPVFTMISGVLFLDPERTISTKKLYQKNILRIVTAFSFWSLIYSVINFESIEKFVSNFLQGPTHLWYCFVIVGLYISVPVVRKISENKRLMIYFLLISFIFAFLIPDFLAVYKNKTISYIYEKTNLNIFLGYPIYFVLGYFLSKISLSKKQRIIIYILGAIGCCATFLGTWIISKRNGSAYEGVYNNFTINVLLESIAVFVFAKELFAKKNGQKKAALKKISGCVFGVYLSHVLIIDLLRRIFNLTTLSFKPVFSVPALAIIVFIISFLISFLINKIPKVNKFIA